MNYDVLVVGAGPAGASAAAAAGKRGVNVLLIDCKSTPGSPVQCAEYVPRTARQYVPLVPGAVVQKIDTLLTFVNDQLVSTLAGPGYMLERSIFDASLVQMARESGTEFWPRAKAISRTDEGVIIQKDGNKNLQVKCKVIIGADGPRSTVGKWMNSENKQFMIGLQYRLPLGKYQTSTDIYFKPEYEGGYAWVFPKGKFANVGVGINVSGKNKLPKITQDFIKDLLARGILLDDQPIQKTGGLIPVGGPLEITQQDNMLLAGDAAGHTHPVTGGGIMNAIVTGKMAGETAANAVNANDMRCLDLYVDKWQLFLGRFLNRAVRQKQDMDRNWTYDQQKFEELIKRTWISFN